MKKTFIIYLFFLLSPFLEISQQINLNGIVSIHNSGYHNNGKIIYVENAQVTADFSTPTTTDNLGKFKLPFVSIENGTSIDVQVEKDQLEVVNERDLQNVVLGRTSNLKVFLAPKGELAKAKTELYEISIKALTAKHDALIAQLRNNDENTKTLIANLEQQLNREIEHRFEAEDIIREQLEEAKKRLPETAKRLASVNLDFASDLYREAFELYQKGEIEAAIARLNEVALETKVEQTLANIADIEEDAEEYLMAKEKVEEQVGQIVDSYQLKAEGYSLLFDYRAAAAVYEKAVGLLERTKEGEDMELADAYGEISTIYYNLGIYQISLDYQLKNLAISEKLLDKSDINLATVYSNLAGIYRELGELEKALGFQKKDIAIGEQVLQEKDSHLATSYNNLSLIYWNLGNLGEALQNQQKAILIQEATLARNHPNIAVSYNNLAIIYLDLREDTKALEAQEKAISIQEQKAGQNDLDLAQSYSNLARIYSTGFIGLEEKALIFQEKAISIQENILGYDHPIVAFSYANLANVYQMAFELEKALEVQKKALVIQQQVLKPNHPHIAISYSNLATTHQLLKQYEEALIWGQKAFNIRRQIFETDHTDIAQSLNNLALTYHALNDTNRAIDNAEKAYKIWLTTLPPSHPNLELVRASLSVFYLDNGDHFLEEDNYQKAIESYEKVLELKLNFQDAHALYKIGLCYYYQKNYKKALTSYDLSYQIDSTYKLMHINNTGLVYAKMGNFQEAQSRFEQLQKLIPDDGLVYRNWALYYTLKNDIPTALNSLEKAIILGYNDLDWLLTDESLEPLRKEPRYQKIIQQLKSQQQKN